MTEFFDALETRDPAQREADLLQDVDPAQVSNRAALAQLPVTRKHELLELQLKSRSNNGNVFGGFSVNSFGAMLPRVFASPGPIYEPEGTAKDYWRMARAIFAAGFRAGDLIHNSFSYHFVPAGSMMETGAHALGCTVFPGGTGQTEQQVQAMAELQPAGYIGRDGCGFAQRHQSHVWRRGLPTQPARLVHCARRGRVPVLRHG